MYDVAAQFNNENYLQRKVVAMQTTEALSLRQVKNLQRNYESIEIEIEN